MSRSRTNKGHHEKYKDAPRFDVRGYGIARGLTDWELDEWYDRLNRVIQARRPKDVNAPQLDVQNLNKIYGH